MDKEDILHIQAPAKVNLFLSVLSRRADGYHELSTWMQKLDLADRISLQPTSFGVKIQCLGANLPEDENNLACKAARIFFKKTRIKAGVAIFLEKKIPIAAGLGGGSSDAAAVLLGLNTLYEAGLTRVELMEIGLLLGADVPFFVADYSAALATGIGEKLQKKNALTDCWFVLVNPGFSVSTKWAYENLVPVQMSNFALTIEGNPDILSRSTESDFSGSFFNDLEKVTISRYPEIEVLKKKLIDAGASASLMSGSGPTVFGIFTDFERADAVKENLEKDFPGRVFLTCPLHSE